MKHKGKFGSFSGETFTGEDCQAGFLCKATKRLPLEGYEEYLKNGNSWYMEKATKGLVEGLTGEHTGIYACNNYDVAKASIGDSVFNFAGQTLGLPLLKDERGDFTELKVGEQYNFGEGNFSTAPKDLGATPYATVQDGLWVASATAPTDGSIYAEVLDISKRFIEGTFDGGQKITLRILRSAKA